MLKKFLARLAYAACTLGALTSCGSSTASGTGEFTTVTATAETPAGPLDSDVTRWESTPCASAGSALPDELNYTVTSVIAPDPNTGQTSPIVPSDIRIRSITLTFTPANSGSPALPRQFRTQYASSGEIIPAGASKDIPVRVVTVALKDFLRSGLGTQSINCSNPSASYSYWVDVSFEGVEISTDRVEAIDAPGLLVNFADFIDK